MYQYRLFKLSEGEHFLEKMGSLTELHLDGVFPLNILARGFTVYNDCRVDQVRFQSTKIVAQISGGNIYETSLTKIQNEIYGACSCPYESACKHLAALLIYLIRELDDEKGSLSV